MIILFQQWLCGKAASGLERILCRVLFNPLPDDKVLDLSKLKQSADNNFEFDVNSRNFSKLVENPVDKREIGRYKQFLLFPHCFQKACFSGVSKGVIVWEWVKRTPVNKSEILLKMALNTIQSINQT